MVDRKDNLLLPLKTPNSSRTAHFTACSTAVIISKLTPGTHEGNGFQQCACSLTQFLPGSFLQLLLWSVGTNVFLYLLIFHTSQFQTFVDTHIFQKYYCNMIDDQSAWYQNTSLQFCQFVLALKHSIISSYCSAFLFQMGSAWFEWGHSGNKAHSISA